MFTISQSEGHLHVGKAIDQSDEGLCLQFTPSPLPPPGAERSYLHYFRVDDWVAEFLLSFLVMLQVKDQPLIQSRSNNEQEKV